MPLFNTVFRGIPMNNKHLEPLGGGIKIYVSDSYRFSTDTILLADFSKQIGAKKCVDLGTGCGTIPLLWYKNNNRLDITAVEIQENACKLFSQSLEYNNLQDKNQNCKLGLKQA